jgi:tripartite-type tricarboxylate transporter receptor subunit TctC
MLVTVNSFVINTSFFDKVRYDPYKDFEPVTLAVASTNVLIVNSSGREPPCVARSRHHPGALQWRRPGSSSRGCRSRALAVTTAMRSEVLPDIPTVAEFLPGYEASGWNGVGAPKNTPVEIVERLNQEIEKWAKVIRAANIKPQ